MLCKWCKEWNVFSKWQSYCNNTKQIILPEKRSKEEENPECRGQNKSDPEQSDLSTTKTGLRVAVSRLEHPLRVAGLVDAVPPAETDLKINSCFVVGKVPRKPDYYNLLGSKIHPVSI